MDILSTLRSLNSGTVFRPPSPPPSPDTQNLRFILQNRLPSDSPECKAHQDSLLESDLLHNDLVRTAGKNLYYWGKYASKGTRGGLKLFSQGITVLGGVMKKL